MARATARYAGPKVEKEMTTLTVSSWANSSSCSSVHIGLEAVSSVVACCNFVDCLFSCPEWIAPEDVVNAEAKRIELGATDGGTGATRNKMAEIQTNSIIFVDALPTLDTSGGVIIAICWRKFSDERDDDYGTVEASLLDGGLMSFGTDF